MKKSILTSAICLLMGMFAAQAQSLSERLDAVDDSMAETRRALERSEGSLETVRQTLYDQALRAREVKLTAEAMRPLRDDPVSGEAVEKLLNQVRSYMALSSQELRSNRDRLDMLGEVLEDAKALTTRLERELAGIRRDAGSTLEVDREAGALRAELEEARASLEQANRALQERDRTLAGLNADKEALQTRLEEMKAAREAEIRMELARDHLATGYEALAAGRFDEASFSFRNELIRNPDSIDARVGLAACLFETGELANARVLVDEVLDADKRNASALGLRGALLYREGDAEEARKDLERAVRYDDENYYNHNYLGVVYQGLGMTSKAIEQVAEAVKLAPEYASGHYNLAILHATSEEPDVEAASNHYNQYLQLGGQPNAELEQWLAQVPAAVEE
jgi:tetratricopeptide (TPR) repeat protein